MRLVAVANACTTQKILQGNIQINTQSLPNMLYNYRITCSHDKLKAELEKVLESQQTPTTLVNFRIVAQKYANTNKEYYLLLANNQDNSLKVGRQLFLQNDNTFIFRQ